FAADHIPYNYKDVCDELAGYKLDNEFGWYENALVIWSGSMKEPVQVDKYCSSIDILPTMLNLCGIEYDSRLITGKDILSDSPQLVLFNGSYSFISDRCKYNNATKEIEAFPPYKEEDITQEYLDAMFANINNKFKLSNLILNYNYYNIVFGDQQ
ncbi:MAG: LTA synthase family protein, partial [Lachnospiraceae bacterium]|nr:LTA synthase family protein [Lachnospiraceae bacterium]